MSAPENPKVIRARKEGKAPLEYLVMSVLEGDAHVHKGGADKYGICNWLKDRIRASTYKGAILRHLKAWAEGEDIDPESGWSHLYHIRACCAIVLDSEIHGTLIDDRQRCESISDKQAQAAETPDEPPSAVVDTLIDCFRAFRNATGESPRNLHVGRELHEKLLYELESLVAPRQVGSVEYSINYSTRPSQVTEFMGAKVRPFDKAETAAFGVGNAFFTN